MNPALTRCPVCKDELVITRLQCQTCSTSIEGHFFGGPFANLSREQMEFIEMFIRVEGKLSRMEGELGLSYPTVRNRLHDVIRAMGYEPGKDDSSTMDEEKRRGILADLDAGRISSEDAMRALNGEEL